MTCVKLSIFSVMPRRNRSKLEHSAFESEIRSIYAEIENRALSRDCQLRSGCCHFRL